MTIREEERSDIPAIRQLNLLAFGSRGEGQLIDRLRSDRLIVTSLVAVDAHEVVGHILFSELPIETSSGTMKGVALAPMCVKPSLQRTGIGAALVREGLEICKKRGYSIAVVLGHPTYYPRFGFSSSQAAGLQSPYSDAGDAFMALELIPGSLGGLSGTVRYPDAFQVVD